MKKEWTKKDRKYFKRQKLKDKKDEKYHIRCGAHKTYPVVSYLSNPSRLRQIIKARIRQAKSEGIL